ncbi:MAG: D-aminoacylase [bacterium]
MANRILIKNGNVIDGSGSAGAAKDVLIEDDRIAAVGETAAAAAGPDATVIDAAGKVVCPGFVDMHAHSDFATSVDGTMAAKLRQGVTTVVMGSCGFSAAPSNERFKKVFLRFAGGMFGKNCPFEWNGMGEYLERLRKQGIAANVFAQVGYGNLRTMTMGMMPRRANEKEIEAMKSLLAQALDEGARGFSTGFAYPPQNFSSSEEIVELCHVVAAKDGLYSTHIRNEMDKIETAMKEAVDTARATGVSLEVSHHKAILKRNWGKVKRTLDILDEARREGVDVETDVYPYDAFSNMFLPCMFLRKEPEIEKAIIFLVLKKFPEFEGRTLAEFMAEKKLSFNAAAFELIKNEGLTKIPIAGRMISEDDMRYVMAHPLTSIGSDGVENPGGKAHPRLVATTVRVIETYALKEKVLSLEEAIKKMTSMPAAKAKLKMRGLIKEQYYADIVVFDPKQIHDRSDYKNTNEHPVGFDAVIVNGEIAVRHDEQSAARAGQVL